MGEASDVSFLMKFSVTKTHRHMKESCINAETIRTNWLIMVYQWTGRNFHSPYGR